MSALEMGWAAGLFVGLVVLPVVATLLHRVLRPLREAKGYAEEILGSGLGIAGNLDGLDEAEQTRSLAVAVPGLASGYLGRRERA